MTNDGFHTYTYDAEGNMLTVDNGTTATYIPTVGGYAPNSNLLAFNDSVDRSFTYTYDYLNRISTATGGPNISGQGLSWTYDSFGNRLTQSVIGSDLAQYAAHSGYSSHNQATSTNLAGAVGYDQAGNITNDGVNSYVIDAESRICSYYTSVLNEHWTNVYDAQGHRVAKGEVPSGLGCATGSGFVPTETDVLGQAGEQFSTLNSSGWQKTNVYANGQLLATYEGSSKVYFALNDWQGTKRALADGNGNLVFTYQSLPFGDGLSASGGPDASDHHYTGQLHDTQSGLDFFGARFYAGNMGRFMSPDPLMATPERLLDPQEWNMYGYARNNPLSITDPTGLDIWLQGCGANSSTCQGNYAGTTDDNGNFSRTHLTGDQTGDASLGTNGISVTQGGNTYQGVWDTNAGEQGAVQVSGAGDLSSFNANITGNCQGTCVASGQITNKDGSPAAAGDVRNALTNPDGSAKPGWFANGNDPFHRHNGTNDTSFNAMNPDTAGQRSTDVTVPQNGNQNVLMHVNSGYPFEDAYQMTRHVISIMHTFMNDLGVTHPTTQ